MPTERYIAHVIGETWVVVFSQTKKGTASNACSILGRLRKGDQVPPVVPEIEGFERADEVDIASEATDPVVA